MQERALRAYVANDHNRVGGGSIHLQRGRS